MKKSELRKLIQGELMEFVDPEEKEFQKRLTDIVNDLISLQSELKQIKVPPTGENRGRVKYRELRISKAREKVSWVLEFLARLK